MPIIYGQHQYEKVFFIKYIYLYIFIKNKKKKIVIIKANIIIIIILITQDTYQNTIAGLKLVRQEKLAIIVPPGHWRHIVRLHQLGGCIGTMMIYEEGA